MPVRLITTPAKNQSSPIYTLIHTAWGNMAFVSSDGCLLRLYLPSRAIRPLLESIKGDFPHAQSAKNNLPQLQSDLANYFHQPPSCSTSRVKSRQCCSTSRVKSRQCDGRLSEKNLSQKPLRFDCQVDISWASEFAQSILKACCKVKPGQTITYSQLALNAAHPRAARAAGSVMAANLVPLIIPCHRIIAANGRLGGYSALGGVKIKAKLLKHEQQIDSSL